MAEDSTTTLSTQTSIHIRPYHPDDRDFVLSLTPRLTIGMAPWRDYDSMHAAMQRFTIESIENSSESTSSHAIVFIAEDENAKCLGFLSVAHNVNFTGEVQAYIGELAVSAEAEGRGIGTALVAAGEDWARTHDYTIIVLDTGAANHRARAMYQHLGFQEESVRLVKVL